MKYYSAREANFATFDDYAKPAILKKGKPNLHSIYEDIFLPAFAALNSKFKPISLKTFYRYCRDRIDVDKKIKAQKGRVALKHETICKKAKFISEGFGIRVEVDAYHEPIALLSPLTFKSIGVRPIHYFAVECRTQVITGVVTDYESKSERACYVIELYKHMLFTKPDFQLIYGTKYPFIFYLRPYLVFHDGGTAFTANNAKQFLQLAYRCSGLSSTQDAPAKAFVENGNKLIKRGFTVKLPGSYDDSQKEYIDPRHYSRDAVLTTLEHHVLLMRYICDEYNFGDVKTKGFNRAERWIEEFYFYPTPRLSNISELKAYQGIEDKKVIQKVVGIQFHILGKSFTYNSEELQKLRRTLKDMHLSAEVEFTRNPYERDEIRVRNIVQDNILVVPIITENDSEIEHLGVGDFYQQFRDTQHIEVLSKMSNEEIIDQAIARNMVIKDYEAGKKQKNKPLAAGLSETVKQDIEDFKATTRTKVLDDTANASRSEKTKKPTADDDVSEAEEQRSDDESRPITSPQNKSKWQKPKGI